jgi:hypothetical protein
VNFIQNIEKLQNIINSLNMIKNTTEKSNTKNTENIKENKNFNINNLIENNQIKNIFSLKHKINSNNSGGENDLSGIIKPLLNNKDRKKIEKIENLIKLSNFIKKQ